MRVWKKISPPVIVLALLALLLPKPAARAQVASSSIRGQVLDPSGAPLPGATVTAELAGTGLKSSSVTDRDGRFFIGGVRPGSYTVSAELVGFKRAVQEELFLRLRDTLELEFSLELAGVEAEVVVTAEAPILDTTTAEVAQPVSEEEIKALPLGDRDYLDLALLTPGVKEGRDPTLLGTQVAFGAQDAASTLVTTDGVDATSLFIGGSIQTFIQETIQEYKVMASSFGAEFGRTPGGAVTVVTKSGTNKIEGSIWEYFRNKDLQTKSEFLEEDTNFERHQYGATVSGPLVKDKTHFFVAFERRDQDSTIATPASALATIPGLAPDFPTEFRTDNLFAKIDQQFGSNQHVFLRFNYENRKTINSPNLTGFRASIATQSNYFTEDQDVYGAMLSHTFSPFDNSFNQLSLNYADGKRPNERNTDAPEELRPSSRQGGFFLAGFDDSQERSFNLTEEFTAQMGRHTLKLGGELQFRHLQLLFPIFSNGQFTFNCIPALPIGPGGALVPDPFGCSADLPFNPLNPFSYPILRVQGFGDPTYEQDRTVAALFISDDIRLSSRLNVNVGVRWDYDSDQFNSSFTSPLITEENPIVPLRMALAGSGLLNPPDRDFDNIAPRLGISYDVAGDGKTLLRGGTGLYYSTLGGTLSLFPQVISGLRISTPAGPLLIGDYAVNVTITPDFNGIPNVLRGGAPESPAPLVYTMDPDAKTPYTWQSTVGVARALGPNMAVTLDLVSAIGRNEVVTVDTNAPTQMVGDTNGDGVPEYNPASRPLPFGPIRTFKTIGESDYKALQIGLQRRYADGWQFQANYTLSEARNWMDNPTSELPQDNLAPEADEAPTSQDQRHILNFSGTVDLPAGLQLSSLAKIASGAPFNIVDGRDLNNDRSGVTNDRRAGVERNSGNADTYFRLDARLSKEFSFGERLRLLFLVEGFNLTNHKNRDPDTYNGIQTSDGFGQPTSSNNATFDPFQVQLGARLSF
jgi:hypothetical protein